MDNLTAGCVKAGLKVVRIGRPEATRHDLEKYNLLEMVKDRRKDASRLKNNRGSAAAH